VRAAACHERCPAVGLLSLDLIADGVDDEMTPVLWIVNCLPLCPLCVFSSSVSVCCRAAGNAVVVSAFNFSSSPHIHTTHRQEAASQELGNEGVEPTIIHRSPHGEHEHE